MATRSPSRRGPTARHVQRMRIKFLWDQGYSDTQISRDPSVNMSWQKVSKWTMRFAEEAGKPDEELILSQPRSGRPKKVTSPIKEKIIMKVKGKRKQSLNKTLKWLKSLHIDISKTTLRRSLWGRRLDLPARWCLRPQGQSDQRVVGGQCAKPHHVRLQWQVARQLSRPQLDRKCVGLHG